MRQLCFHISPQILVNWKDITNNFIKLTLPVTLPVNITRSKLTLPVIRQIYNYVPPDMIHWEKN